MENCGIHACAKIRITCIPSSNDQFGLTTPDGITHTFAYDYNNASTAEYPIQIRPSGYGSDTLEDVKAKTVLAIQNTGLFVSVMYDAPNNYIWVCQSVFGVIGNTVNTTNSSGCLFVSNFGGGEEALKGSFGDGSVADSTNQAKAVAEFEKGFNKKRATEAKLLAQDKKRINNKKKKAKNCKPLKNAALNALKNLLKQKLCPCPTCNAANKVKDKVAGRNYYQIPFTEFRIPRFDHLVDKIPTFDQNRRDGEKCGACEGSKKIVDVADDTKKYDAVAQKIEQNSEKIMERESKLGLGGTRTTIIQGSDLLFVGLGFNNNKTYEVIPGGAIAPTMRGGKIPQQNSTPVNAVVGKQGSLAWPQQVGNYTIKCANKFNLLAGAGGITIATPGPLTFSSGMMKFVGPQIAIGCSNGPLTLEGDSVNISGKAISITPTGGELFVKGNISNTGNITTQGHAHFESASFAKAACVGVNKSTYASTANADVLNTQRATWSNAALAAALLDLQTFYQSIPTDSETSSFRLLSPKENQNISDRMRSIAKLSQPWEYEVTGYILPGTEYYAYINGYPAQIVLITTCDLHNFPHVHGIPEMKHSHEVYLPDMDYTNDSPQSLRDKILTASHEHGVPADPTKDTTTRLDEVKRTAVEYSASAVVEKTKAYAKKVRMDLYA